MTTMASMTSMTSMTSKYFQTEEIDNYLQF